MKKTLKKLLRGASKVVTVTAATAGGTIVGAYCFDTNPLNVDIKSTGLMSGAAAVTTAGIIYGIGSTVIDHVLPEDTEVEVKFDGLDLGEDTVLSE